jgi:hypothetical protein
MSLPAYILLYWRGVLGEAAAIVLSGFGLGRRMQILAPLLVVAIGIARFLSEGRSSQEVFDYVDGLVAGAWAIGISAGIIFFLAVIIVPAKRARRQDQIIEELRAQILSREKPGQDLAISCEEIVIGGVGMWRATGAPPGPTRPGTYLVARGFQLTNCSRNPAVLSVKLQVSMPNGRYTATPRALNWLQPLEPGAFSAHDDFIGVLGEPALGQPINLDPTKGAAGRLTFYLGINLNRDDTENADALRTADIKWEIHDSISRVTTTYPVARTKDKWRVLPCRW